MDNGNDPPTCIPCLEISDKNMIPRNSSFICMEFPVYEEHLESHKI